MTLMFGAAIFLVMLAISLASAMRILVAFLGSRGRSPAREGGVLFSIPRVAKNLGEADVYEQSIVSELMDEDRDTGVVGVMAFLLVELADENPGWNGGDGCVVLGGYLQIINHVY